MSTPIVIPTDIDMHPVSDDEIAEYTWGVDVILAMRQLNLGMYHDPDGYYWVGSLTTFFPHHDRWLYRIQPDLVREADNWDLMRVEIPRNCAGPDTPDFIDDGLFSVLENMEKLFTEALNKMGPMSQKKRRRLADNYFSGVQAFDYVGKTHIDCVLHAVWNQESHDLLRHYDVWAASQVEPLPRDIALRMYGFGAYVDALDAGKEWLV